MTICHHDWFFIIGSLRNRQPPPPHHIHYALIITTFTIIIIVIINKGCAPFTYDPFTYCPFYLPVVGKRVGYHHQYHHRSSMCQNHPNGPSDLQWPSQFCLPIVCSFTLFRPLGTVLSFLPSPPPSFQPAIGSKKTILQLTKFDICHEWKS